MFRFPKDLNYRKEWIQKCRRGDHFNPNTSFICSDHFTVVEFVRGMQAELLGSIFKIKLVIGTL